ncbi:hypothetical protein K1719_004821 [Acacia pycnantha]|nr:hypothetical protein K1719_004821 [Acacia pycnantha]
MASYKIFYLFIICNVCCEFYPFYQSEAASVPPTNTTASQGKGGISGGMAVAIVVPISVAVVIFIVGICCFNKRTRKKYDSDPEEPCKDPQTAIGISNVDSLQYDSRTVEATTNNFSADNKLGEGGFGKVYEGTLAIGQEVAVKRHSRYSQQGVREFKNEVEMLAKLKHRNLVRLLGFCVQGEEKILVYEYVPNKSLDYILFDPKKKRELDWTKHNQTHEDTYRVTRTVGYTPPEYVLRRVFSIKFDVYNFGILLIEIISGRKNSFVSHINGVVGLLSYAWILWENGESMELLDPTLRESYTPNEVMRCIHIGLLCVQEDPAQRPPISSILLMLEYYSMTLPTPLQPAFFDKTCSYHKYYCFPRKGGMSWGTIVAIVVPISVAVLILIVGICCLCKRIWNNYDSDSAIGISNVDSLQYDFSTIEEATNKFSQDNKLGEGGFGPVYKGTFANGQEIAVKRLSHGSGQGKEKILVYEYVPNKSLDHIFLALKSKDN